MAKIGRLEFETHPEKKQPIQQQTKFNPPDCLSCKLNHLTEMSHEYICLTPECEFIMNKRKHPIDKKLFRQGRNFSTRLSYANKKTRETFYSMADTI